MLYLEMLGAKTAPGKGDRNVLKFYRECVDGIDRRE
jgi:hypothetical protein